MDIASDPSFQPEVFYNGGYDLYAQNFGITTKQLA